MLAISVEWQVLTDFIYGHVSQKFGRNFSELVSSASALCGSVQLRVRLKSQNLQWKPFCAVIGRKGRLKPLGLVCKRGEKKLLCLMIFMQKISWCSDYFSSLFSSLWAFYKETFILRPSTHNALYTVVFCAGFLHVAEVFLWNYFLEPQFSFCFLGKLFFFGTPWRLKRKMK